MRSLLLAAVAAMLVPAAAVANAPAPPPPKTKSTKAIKDEEPAAATPSVVPVVAGGVGLSLAVLCGGLVAIRSRRTGVSASGESSNLAE